jgi:hypothetical protein
VLDCRKIRACRRQVETLRHNTARPNGTPTLTEARTPWFVAHFADERPYDDQEQSLDTPLGRLSTRQATALERPEPLDQEGDSTDESLAALLRDAEDASDTEERLTDT